MMTAKVFYYTDLKGLTQEELTQAFAIAPPARKQKIRRYRFDKDRRLSLMAYLLFVLAYEHASGELPPMIDFQVSVTGKPYLPQSAWSFNLSHCDLAVGCAISNQAVGLDIQDIQEVALDQAFTEQEIEEINQAPCALQAAIRLWALKESYVKYLGAGLGYGLKRLDFSQQTHPFRYQDAILSLQQIDNIFLAVSSHQGVQEYIKVTSEELVQLIERLKQRQPIVPMEYTDPIYETRNA